MPATPDLVRRLALELPRAYETPHRGAPSFRVNERIFCLMPPGEARITLKLDRDDQLNMFAAHAGVVTAAQHYSHHGWTYVWLARADEALMRTLLWLAWTHVAPKRLVKASRLAM